MKTFEEKVKSLTIKEIVGYLIEGIKNPVIKLDFYYFGVIDKENECIACGATNAICKISGITFDASNIGFMQKAKALECSEYFYDKFENALDFLRLGSIRNYNFLASQIGIATLETDIKLPELENHNYKENLPIFEKLYESL